MRLITNITLLAAAFLPAVAYAAPPHLASMENNEIAALPEAPFNCIASKGNSNMLFYSQGTNRASVAIGMVNWGGRDVALHSDHVDGPVFHATDGSGLVVALKKQPGKTKFGEPYAVTVTGRGAPPQTLTVDLICEKSN